MAKKLRESDMKRLSIPKEWWELIRPLFGEEEDHRREIELWMTDGAGMFWEFQCAVRKKGCYKKPVLQSNSWNKFINYKGLRAGDVVILEPDENQFRGTRFKLRALKKNGQYWFDV